MVELVYVGAPGRSFADPPVGHLEPGQHVHAEDEVAERLLRTGDFETASRPEPEASAQKSGAGSAAKPDIPAQED